MIPTAKDILDCTTCCTIEEDVDIDDINNLYYKHEDVLKAMEEHAESKAKEAAWWGFKMGYRNFITNEKFMIQLRKDFEKLWPNYE